MYFSGLDIIILSLRFQVFLLTLVSTIETYYTYSETVVKENRFTLKAVGTLLDTLGFGVLIINTSLDFSALMVKLLLLLLLVFVFYCLLLLVIATVHIWSSSVHILAGGTTVSME